MTHVDLFTGLAGFSLAAEANGIRTVAMCECDPHCRDFLAKAWPGVPVHPDVRTFPGEQYRGAFLLTAGVPCQPASRAGKQGGAGDDRWLWPAALAALESVRPAWALFENPPGIEDVGLDGILAEVEGKGYEIGPVFDIPACAVDAPHRRQRLWIVAHRKQPGQKGCAGERTAPTRHWPKTTGEPQGPLPDAGEGDAGRRAEVPLGGPQGRVDAGRAGEHVPDAASAGSAPRTPGRFGTADAKADCRGAATRAGGDFWSEQGRVDAGRAGEHVPDAQRERQLSSIPTPGTLSRHVGEADTTNRESIPRNCWSDYIWAAFPDGKVRRAPGNSVSLVDGLHRSVLGALGNSIVWQVAAEIIAAIVAAEAEA